MSLTSINEEDAPEFRFHQRRWGFTGYDTRNCLKRARA